MKIVFAATGEIAIPLMEALHKEGLISLVLTAPDSPGKRGKQLVAPPIKARALELGLEVYQPETIRTEVRNHIASYNADALLSFCYGKIFGPKFLSLFENTFNVHPSLLPLYRGCSPIYEAIRNCDEKTGITLQRIGLGVDEGDVFSSIEIPLDGTETEESLSKKVSEIAPSFVLPVLLDENRESREQSGAPSYSSFVKKEDGRIDLSAPSAAVHAQIRACYPWPKAYALLDGEPVYLTGVYGSVFSIEHDTPQEEPGTLCAFVKGKGLKLALSDGYIYITRILPPMRKEMDSASFLNGRKDAIGKVLR